MIPADFIYIDTDVYNAYQYVIDKSVVVQEGVFVYVPDILLIKLLFVMDVSWKLLIQEQ